MELQNPSGLMNKSLNSLKSTNKITGSVKINKNNNQINKRINNK